MESVHQDDNMSLALSLILNLQGVLTGCQTLGCRGTFHPILWVCKLISIMCMKYSSDWLGRAPLREKAKLQNRKQICGCLGWEWVEGLTSLVKELVVVTKTDTEFVKIHRL